ncbi:f31dbbb6-31fd-472f-a049-1f230bda1299 [Thermothielavioides terrestris]|uniref:F31dbbb6-31fd-472f-a049-1f230bda1299 n=1 Tax=Thermothielavioides terrestris TaxID=2587410 RepID=A0A3S4ASM1_9PEZI|nr:f31dbbb6-31fd-472f-a049-1f230bda1299 [Thermothielavioides terrestris]
MPIDRLELSS